VVSHIPKRIEKKTATEKGVLKYVNVDYDHELKKWFEQNALNSTTYVGHSDKWI